MFLLYINGIPQGLSDSNTYLYAEDTGIFHQHQEITEIKNVLNNESANVCNGLMIISCQFILMKIKLNAFFLVRKKTCQTKESNGRKQIHIVEYLGCYLDANLSGESMAMKSLKKINAKLEFLHRQKEFLNAKLDRLLCNSLIQPHFQESKKKNTGCSE